MRASVRLGLAAVVLASLAIRQDLPAQNANDWGTIKGRIVWSGAIPERDKIDDAIKKTQDAKVCLMNGSVLSEKWVINAKNKGLRWTFVWLIPEGKGNLPIHPALQKPPAQPVVIDQPLCMFIPHALAVREGQSVLVKNSASITHNFKYGGHPDINPGSNFIMPPGTEQTIKNLKADKLPISIECSIHPWMNGKMMVFDHPYYMVTDENGTFEIKDAPAGNFRIIARHSTGIYLGGAEGRNGKAITIKGGQVNDLGDWEFAAPK